MCEIKIKLLEYVFHYEIEAETYFGPCQTPMMEHFCKNSEWLLDIKAIFNINISSLRDVI